MGKTEAKSVSEGVSQNEEKTEETKLPEPQKQPSESLDIKPQDPQRTSVSQDSLETKPQDPQRSSVSQHSFEYKCDWCKGDDGFYGTYQEVYDHQINNDCGHNTLVTRCTSGYVQEGKPNGAGSEYIQQDPAPKATKSSGLFGSIRTGLGNALGGFMF